MGDAGEELGAEASKLVSAVQEWARTAFAAHPAGSHATGAAPSQPSECVPWCPICQFAGILRGEHPEVAERLAEAGAALASAMKALSDAAIVRAQAAQPGAGRNGRPRPAPRVEHIRLDDPDES
jgi:hypothetical protein